MVNIKLKYNFLGTLIINLRGVSTKLYFKNTGDIFLRHFYSACYMLAISKVVQYKIQSRIEEKRKKALDVHLNFIVGQTEKYSSWLAESLKEPKPSGSVASSGASSTVASSPVSSRQEDTGNGIGVYLPLELLLL